MSLSPPPRSRGNKLNPFGVAFMFILVVAAGAALSGLFVMIAAWALNEAFPSGPLPALSYKQSFLVGIALSVIASFFKAER